MYDPKQATTGYSFHKKNFTIGFLPWRLYRNSPKKARKQCDVNSTVLHLDICLVVVVRKYTNLRNAAGKNCDVHKKRAENKGCVLCDFARS